MVNLGCGMKCLKYLLFAFNFIFWVAGIAVLAIGIWSRIEAKDWDSLLGDDGTIVNASNLMIAAGAFVMLIGFFGCCGAIKQNRFLLILYAILLMLIFILEIAAGIYAYTKKDTVIDKLEENFAKAVMTSYGKTTKSDESLTKGVDWFQEHVKCCGAAKPEEWKGSDWFIAEKAKAANATNLPIVPATCCIDKAADKCNYGAEGGFAALTTIHTKGCVKEGQEYIKDHLWQIGGAGVGIAFIQLFGIVAAILLCRSISEKNNL